MNITLHQLHIFTKVSELRSISRAANALHLTQPAVSIQLKKLQEQFDMPLYEVVGRQLYITEFGEELALHAETMIAQMHAINYKMLAYKGKLSGKLNIAVVTTGKYIMPFFLAPFLKRNEEIELKLEVANRVLVIESLERNLVDFALVSIVPQNINLDHLPLMPNLLFMMGPKSLEIDDCQNMQQLLLKYPLIFREEGSGTRQALENYLNRHQLKVGKRLVLSSNDAVKQALLAGMGCSLLSLISAKDSLRQGDLRIIEMPGLPVQTEWNLVWPRGKKHSVVAQSFLKFVQENREHIVGEHFSILKSYLP